MLNRTKLTLLATAAFAFQVCAQAREVSPAATQQQQPASAPTAVQGAASDRAQDGLTGPVRRVKTETAKITTKGGKPVEGPRVLLESATYDIKGAKVDTAYFLAAAGGTLTGKEAYKYDDKGNLVEMTLRDDAGTLLSKEVYGYEFDALGNWTKMVTSVAVVEGGRMTFEPTEVTYRTISYFLDEATLARMSQPAAAPAPAAAQPAAAENKTPAMTAAAPRPSPSAPSVNADAKAAKGAAPKMAAAPPPVASDRMNVAAPSVVASVGGGAPAAAVVVSEGEAPERPAARGSLKPVSGGILNGKAVSLPAPAFPQLARRAQIEGTVTVEVVIDLNGRVVSATAVDGPAMLRGAAEQAARLARFSPTLLSGVPVRMSGQIRYNFTIR
jgi:protein TonB